MARSLQRDFVIASILTILLSSSCAVLDAAEAGPGSAAATVNNELHTYSAICAVGHNENLYVLEWVKYHLCLGIGVIHLFDHDSKPRMDGELSDFIKRGQVTYDLFEGHHTRFTKGYTSTLERFKHTAQGYAYNTCLQKYASRHHFVGFIDIDEFIVISDPLAKDFDAILNDYQNYGGVSFHWRTLGSTGHEKRPQQPVVDAYTSCLPRGHHVHRQIKSFVNTKFHPIMISPHRAEFRRGEEALDFHAVEVQVAEHHDNSSSSGGAHLVDEAFNIIKHGWNKGRWSRASVYHYVTKSREDFQVKLDRGGGAGITRNMEYFDKVNKAANETCTGAVQTRKRFCPRPGGTA